MAQTQRQRIIEGVGRKLGRHNYNAYARLNDLPYTEDWQKRVDDHKERFDTNLICEHVDQLYSTMFTNSVESFLMGWIDDTHPSHGYTAYVDGINDRSFKMLLNAIVKKADETMNIYIDGERAKIRIAQRAEKESNS